MKELYGYNDSFCLACEIYDKRENFYLIKSSCTLATMQNVDVGNVLYRLTLKYISGKLNIDGTIYYNLIRYKDGIVIPLKKKSVSIRESNEIIEQMG